MSAKEKVLKALNSAKTRLKNSLEALNRKDENMFANCLWYVATELEYALFILSIMQSNQNDSNKWKLNPETKKIEMGPLLVNVENLITEAEEYVAVNRSLDAYKNLYIARNFVLKVQEDIAKRKREKLGKN